MRKRKAHILAFFAVSFLVLVPLTNICAQTNNPPAPPLKFSPNVSAAMKKLGYQILQEKVESYKDKYGGMGLYLYYAFSDLNDDGKNEIFIQFHEEYDFRDKYGNVDTHVFTMLGDKPVEVLETKAYAIVPAPTAKNGVKKLYIYRQPNTKKPYVYEWNGKDKFTEQNE